jgi:hypothetical protein
MKSAASFPLATVTRKRRCETVRRPFATVCLLIAWFCANGAIWDVVQVFAWTSMFTGYAQEMPVAQALKETFDPNKPCELCTTVAKAREHEQKQTPPPLERAADKLLLAMQTPVPLVFRGPPTEWPESLPDTGVTRTESVPVPPPRA